LAEYIGIPGASSSAPSVRKLVVNGQVADWYSPATAIAMSPVLVEVLLDELPTIRFGIHPTSEVVIKEGS